MLDVIETERLRLRPYAEGDLDAIVDLYRRPAVTRFLTRAAEVHDLEQARAWLARVTSRCEAHVASRKPYGGWAIEARSDGRVIGTCLLKPLPDAGGNDTPEIEVGWHLHPDRFGQGYATEAGRALLERGLARLDVARLHALIDRGNDVSVRVARRLGMDLRGVTDRYYGSVADLFAIDRVDFDRRSGAARRAWSVSVFARHEGAILLVFHKRLDSWLPVGGEVEGDETPLEAARRELFEETGLDGMFRSGAHDEMDGVPRGFLGYEEHMAGKKGLHLNASFVCDVLTREVRLDDSLSDHRWVTLADGPWDLAPANVRELARRALAASVG